MNNDNEKTCFENAIGTIVPCSFLGIGLFIILYGGFELSPLVAAGIAAFVPCIPFLQTLSKKSPFLQRAQNMTGTETTKVNVGTISLVIAIVALAIAIWNSFESSSVTKHKGSITVIENISYKVRAVSAAEQYVIDQMKITPELINVDKATVSVKVFDSECVLELKIASENRDNWQVVSKNCSS